MVLTHLLHAGRDKRHTGPVAIAEGIAGDRTEPSAVAAAIEYLDGALITCAC